MIKNIDIAKKKVVRIFNGDWYEVSLKLLLSAGAVTATVAKAILHSLGIGVEALSEMAGNVASMANEIIDNINDTGDSKSIIDDVSESRRDGDETTNEIE